MHIIPVHNQCNIEETEMSASGFQLTGGLLVAIIFLSDFASSHIPLSFNRLLAPDIDVNVIMQIQIGNWEGDDYLAWNYTSVCISLSNPHTKPGDLMILLFNGTGRVDLHHLLPMLTRHGVLPYGVWLSELNWLGGISSSMLDAPSNAFHRGGVDK